MSIELRRTSRSHAAYRAVLWASVALGLGVFYLGQRPWELEAEEELSEGAEIAREAQADIIVVIDYDTIKNSGPEFEAQDWSAAWINLVEQEFGPVSIATPQSLSNKVLSDARVVILTSSVSSRINDSMMVKLREHLDAGKLLVMERPSGALRETWAADGRAGKRRGQAITFTRDIPAPYQHQIQAMPLSTDYIGSTRAPSDATTLLSIDGAPAIYARPVGDGVVVTVDFDLGEQLVAMQQGKPTEKMRVVAREKTRPEDPPRTTDLIMDEGLVGNPIPYADLLERFIAHGVIARYAMTPSLWPYPSAADGVMVALHEDDQLGDGGGWMLDHEVERKAVSTLLTSMDSGLTAAGAATIHRKGGDIGLLWQMAYTPAGSFERMGVGGFEPIARPVTLKKQLASLKETLPVSYVRTARISGGWWTEQWDQPFSVMAKQGLRVDMSYEVPRTSGYAWGTGLPFLAMRSDGVPLGMRELPVVFPDRAIEGPALEDMLQASEEGHHMAMTFSMAPSSFADYPDLDRFNEWLAMFDALEKHHHAMTSAYRFDGFMRKRRASSLRSRLVTSASLPVASSKPTANLPANAKKKKKPAPPTPAPTSSNTDATLLRVTIEAKAHGITLMVPTLARDKRFHSARQRSNRLGKEGSSANLETKAINLIGMPMTLIVLERGFNTIDIYYVAE